MPLGPSCRSLADVCNVVHEFVSTAGHWKLSHTTKNFILQQGILLANLGLFTFARNSPRLFDSFGFTEAKPAFIAFTLFQLISSPIDEVGLLSLLNLADPMRPWQTEMISKCSRMAAALACVQNTC